MEQTPKGALRPWRSVHGQVGVAGPEAEAAHSVSEAPARLWGARMEQTVGATRIRGAARLGATVNAGRDKPVPYGRLLVFVE